MPVTIDELSSSLMAEGDVAPGESAHTPMTAEQLDQLWMAERRLARDRERTSAEGFDD